MSNQQHQPLGPVPQRARTQPENGEIVEFDSKDMATTKGSQRKRKVNRAILPESPPAIEVVRLSVNLLPDSAATLKSLCGRNDLNLTEGIKRAIRLWKIVDDATTSGGRVLIESSSERGESIYREVLFV